MLLLLPLLFVAAAAVVAAAVILQGAVPAQRRLSGHLQGSEADRG
jgi:hypothetical protein